MHRVSKLKAKYKILAIERIERLFELADQASSERRELTDRYMQLARRLVTRYNVRLPVHLKRKICKRCFAFLKPGITCRVRIRSKRSPHLVITCLRCGYQMRLPYESKKR